MKWNTSQLYTSGVLSVVPAYFEPGEFITYGQDDWGTQNTPASQLLLNHFFEVYPSGVEIGISGAAGNSAVFTTRRRCDPRLFADERLAGPPGQ